MLPQIFYAVQLMGESGIGAAAGTKWGRFTLEKVSIENQTVYSDEKGSAAPGRKYPANSV
jgi:hypothetical protein